MKKSIIYILFALFSFSAAVSLTACKDDGVEISDAYKSKTPKNVKLLEYGNKSLTICWDFVRGATSYTVQLVDGDMNPVSEALCMTTADIDYHEFTDLPTDRIYYGRVRANYPYSATSDWVYVTEHDKPAMLMASVGILDLDPQLKLHAASGSTLTFEWSYTDDKATDAARSYNVELFRDEACTDLYVSWLADGKLSSGKGIFTALAGYPVVRYTFSGLDPETTYYARITNLSFANIQTPVVAGTTTQAGPKAAANTPAKAGDIVLAQDFSAFIHGGDIVNSAAGYNAVSGTDFRKTWEKAEGVNPQADGDRPLCNWATEFHIHTGGTSAEYVEALGMKGWGSSGNTSTRPGYIKCGGGSGGIGILYTPQLTALPANTTVKVSFSASAYAEGENVYGSDIVVEAVEGAEFGSNNVVSKKGTAFVSKTVDISSAVGRFETYTVTLEGLTPASRIAFSSNPAQAGANKTRFLLDDIVVTCEGETHLEQLAAPANVKFDAEAVQPDKLTLKWDAVSGAASYTVACWADGTDESKAALVEKIDGTACTLDKLTPETKYNAKVKAVAGRTATDSDWSAKASATTAEASQGKLDAPANLKAEPGFSTVALTWDAVSGATGYSVTVDNGTPQTVTDNAFTATGLTAGTSHDFSVVALAALAADNSDAATLQSKTLYVRIAAVTTSSIILEWEQAGDVSQYTVAIEEEGDPSRSARFTYDWSKASGYGSIPLRFAFNYVGTEWASAALSPSASYRLRVKAGAADSDSAWSNDITGTVARRTAPAMESIPTDNARLTAAIRDGSREAFDEMCGRYYAPLMAYARLFLKGNWAQDIVQDVFVNVWIRRETLDPRQSLYGYLLRSVYNQSVNYVNKNRHAGNYRSYHQERIESIGYAYYDPDNNPIIEKIYSQDLRAGIDAAVAALPEKCREVFTLSYLQGFSHREISERLGIAQSTVENHIYLALKALRSKLSKSELLMLLFFIFLCNNSQSFG